MKTSQAAAICIILVCALCGCMTASAKRSVKAFAEATPLCALLDDPKPYVGKRVLVSGYLTRHPHGRSFFDEGCDRGFIPVNFLQTVPSETAKGRRLRLLFNTFADRSSRKPPKVPVVYSGILTDHSPGLVCHMLCSSFSLESAEIAALRPR
jgi:hypothetical protein